MQEFRAQIFQGDWYKLDEKKKDYILWSLLILGIMVAGHQLVSLELSRSQHHKVGNF